MDALSARARDDRANRRYEQVVGDLRKFTTEEYEFLQPIYEEMLWASRPRPSLLDIGCGVGVQAVAAARCGFHVVGVDHSHTALMAARHLAALTDVTVRLVLADARWLPFARSARFDVVQCLGNVLLLQRNLAEAQVLLETAVSNLGTAGWLLLGWRDYQSSHGWSPRTDTIEYRVTVHESFSTLRLRSSGHADEPFEHCFELLRLPHGWLIEQGARLGVRQSAAIRTNGGFNYSLLRSTR
ncbi:class I SAM-dependent methyltransferase [Actinomadura sp. 3N508]|uniref:class I SAM-dependent methyltransferase n=1 Tax=Actinomadura sp. 3N508 TaxID=3375153 RepID=UPI00379B1718